MGEKNLSGGQNRHLFFGKQNPDGILHSEDNTLDNFAKLYRSDREYVPFLKMKYKFKIQIAISPIQYVPKITRDGMGPT